MQELDSRKKHIVDFFMKKGVLLSQDLLEKLEDKETFSQISKFVDDPQAKNIAVLNKKTNKLAETPSNQEINWTELEKLKTVTEKKNNKNFSKLFEHLLQDQIAAPKKDSSTVKIVFSSKAKPKKMEAQDFVDHFKTRFKFIENILKQRLELRNSISISRLIGKKDREQVAVIGMVSEVQTTKNGNLMVTLEDETGNIKAIISKSKPDVFLKSKDIILDDVIGITGVNGNNVLFVNNILYPDIPDGELKKLDKDAYAIFLSDLHVGSKYFLEDDFKKFLRWLNRGLGNDTQREIASKVEYVFIVGDLVDGCGIYPDQDKELKIKDIKLQYQECAELLKQIPSGMQIIICPGNHDAMRVAEPQPPFYREFAEPLYNLQNVTLVSNPALVNIGKSSNFPGFDVLLYHGYSFDHYVAEVESIRNNGGYDRADLIMKFLLQKRHLAPTHISTLYSPDPDFDCLIIRKTPDFFVSGHIHKAAAANYKNVTLISGSCWQSKTSFQEKVGHKPEPSRVPAVNLKTRRVRILKFGQ